MTKGLILLGYQGKFFSWLLLLPRKKPIKCLPFPVVLVNTVNHQHDDAYTH
jgi:hypothetical protein